MDALQLFPAEVRYVLFYVKTNVLNTPIVSLPVRISGSQTFSQQTPPNAGLFPTLDSSRTHLCFPFPPSHKSLSYITGRQGDAIHCTATSQCAHMGQPINRGRHRKGKGQRETDGNFYVSVSRTTYYCTNCRVRANIICAHCDVLILKHVYVFICRLTHCPIPSRII